MKFKEHVEEAKVYFIACSDGATYSRSKVKSTTLTKQDMSQGVSRDADYQKTFLRQRILRYATNGLDVALLNGMEFRDSKVFCFVIAGSKKSSGRVNPHSLPLGDTRITRRETSIDEGNGSNLRADIPLLLQTVEMVEKDLGITTRSWRLLATVIALHRMSLSTTEGIFAKACLTHSVLLEMIPLAKRNFSLQRFELTDEADLKGLLHRFCKASLEALDHQTVSNVTETRPFTPDYLDGRLLRQVWNMLKYKCDTNYPLLLKETASKLSPLISLVSSASIGTTSSLAECSTQSYLGVEATDTHPTQIQEPLLAFRHPVFDKHLSSIQLIIEQQDSSESLLEGRNFLELKHWHNYKKHLIPKRGHYEEQCRDPRWLKRHQRLLKDLSAYAASLTNASGKTLEPESIILDISQKNKSVTVGDKPTPKKAGRGNGNAGSKVMNRSTASKKDAIITSQAQKKDKEQTLVFQAWQRKREDLDKIPSPLDRFIAASSYVFDVEKRKRIDIMRNEVLLYRLAALLQIWKAHCQKSEKVQGYHVIAIALDLLHQLSATSDDIPKEAPRLLRDITRWLGLPVPALTGTGDKSLSFPFFSSGGLNISVEMDPIKFRLLHGGPYMDRSMGSQQDHRVPFHPDAWQKQVLDELDKHTSLLLVVPTGGGKTFISFYAMEKILRANDDDVVVYVAPTKALVNQIAAEITARFTKTYKHGGKTLCGVHTRDIRIHNPTQCQVLVTVPHMLQIMMLSPSNKDWVPRVKTIIFDEVHSISASDDGVVWEQLLMMAPCQIIALSATVGNPEAFGSWLQSTQKAKGRDFGIITHDHRFSDLRKYSFHPLSEDKFKGLSSAPALSPLGLDGTKVFDFLHPVSSITSSTRSIPVDLALESRDCYLLFDVLKKYETEKFPIPRSLAPEENFATNSITKAEVISWAKKLKDFLATWMARTGSPFQETIAELSELRLAFVSGIARSTHSRTSSRQEEDTNENVVQTTLPLLQNLHAANALPAILFNFARGRCEEIAIGVFDCLVEAERTWKDTDRSFKDKVAKFRQWQEHQETVVKRAAKVKNKAGKGDRSQRDDASGQLSRAEREREILESFDDPFSGFDPDGPLNNFSFASPKKSDRNELDAVLGQLRWKGVNDKLISAFQRGIAAHHAGLNKAYRQAVEIWFRRGYLTVVIATGTLALGINMPCKTVVFTEDSVFLTTLNYRQASGRAGRRGFDLLGNVVFHGISKEKARRLMSARIPALIGHFPVTTSLVLRLFILLHNTNNAEYAVAMVESLLSQPRLYLGGESFRHQVLHHLRFSIEYLRRQGLVAGDGAPINFASSVAHLYYVEQSAFGFHALLRGGYFTDLAEGMCSNEEETLRTLMLVMAHVFFRHPIRQAEKESEDSERIQKSPSIVFLPTLPEAAASVLRKHNDDTLKTYRTYVQTFVEQHCKDPEDALPFTGFKIRTQSRDNAKHQLDAVASPNPPVRLRSPFVALSGHTDSFTSISSLCDTVRSGVFLEKAVVPYIEISDVSNPLNAFLYDFYRHGAVKPLVVANKVRSGDVWFLLDDFSMVLATLVSSMEGFLASGGSNFDGDLDGVGEEADEADDDEENNLPEEDLGAKPETKPLPVLAKKKETVEVLENWDDAGDEDDNVEIPLPRDEDSGRKSRGSRNAIRTPSPTKSSYVSETTSTGATSDIEGDASAAKARETEEKLKRVSYMFQRLKAEFDGKFHKIFA